MARKNAANYPYMDTVLFFDEANTTEAIGVIKEIMCDKSLEKGWPLLRGKFSSTVELVTSDKNL
jgi:hypothetical protein